MFKRVLFLIGEGLTRKDLWVVDEDEIVLLAEETSLYAEENQSHAEQQALMSNKFPSLQNKFPSLHNNPTSHAHERSLTPHPRPNIKKEPTPQGQLFSNLLSIPFALSSEDAHQNLLQTPRRLQILSPHRTTGRTSSLSPH